MTKKIIFFALLSILIISVAAFLAPRFLASQKTVSPQVPQTRRLHLQDVSTTTLPFNYTRRDYWPKDSQFTNRIKLLDYRIAVIGKNMDFWTFRWQTKVENAHIYPVNINYYIEFRNQNSSLLELLGPISHGINVAKDGGKLITDQGIYRMKSLYAKDFDPAFSRIYIRVRR